MDKHKEGNTKLHILNIARSEFAARGYYATSMDSITKTTGLSKGAIYWHFKSKRDLFKAVLENEAANVKKIVFPRKEDLQDKDLKQFFLERGERLIDFHLSSRENTLLWLHISVEAQRGNTEVADIAIDILDSTINELIAKITEFAPDISRSREELDLKELILLLEAVFNGLLLDLQFKRNPALVKKFWRFLVNKLLTEGEQK